MEIHVKEIIPFSSRHWPGENCAVVKLAGCNFKCPYCAEPECLEFKEEFIVDVRDVQREIEEAGMDVKNIFFTGGEPTLQQEGLIELARFCKKKKLNVGIDTNGSKYFTIKKLLEHALVDYISLDIKAALSKEGLFEKVTKSATFFRPISEIITDVRKTIDILKIIKRREIKGLDEKEPEIEVKTTIVPGLMYRKEDLMEIGREIEGLNCTWVLNQFYRGEEESLVDKRFETIKFPSLQFLKNLKDAMEKEFPELRIEVRSWT